MRQTRSAMLDSLGADYVRTARAKGLAERSVVGSHALRNSLITVVTVIGLQLGALISGAVVTEQIFVIPGFGKLTIDSVFQRDYPLIQGVVLVAAVGYVVINLARRRPLLGARPAHPGVGRARDEHRVDVATHLPRAPARRRRIGRRFARRPLAVAGARDRRCSSLVALAAPLIAPDGPGRDRLRRRRSQSAVVVAPDGHRRARPRRALARDLGRPRVAGGRRAGDAAGDGRRPSRSGCSPATSAAGATRSSRASPTCCWRSRSSSSPSAWRRSSGRRCSTRRSRSGIAAIPGLIRVTRGEVLALREQEFVRRRSPTARATGVILRRHILPEHGLDAARAGDDHDPDGDHRRVAAVASSGSASSRRRRRGA